MKIRKKIKFRIWKANNYRVFNKWIMIVFNNKNNQIKIKIINSKI